MQLLDHFELQFKKAEQQFRKQVKEECQQQLMSEMEHRIRRQLPQLYVSDGPQPSQLQYFSAILTLFERIKEQHDQTIRQLHLQHSDHTDHLKQQFQKQSNNMMRQHKQQLSTIIAKYRQQLQQHNEQHFKNSSIILQQQQQIASLNIHLSNLLQQNTRNKQHYDETILQLQNSMCLQHSQLNQTKELNTKYRQYLQEIEQMMECVNMSVEFSQFNCKIMEFHALSDHTWKETMERQTIVRQIVNHIMGIQVPDVSMPQLSYQQVEYPRLELAGAVNQLQQSLINSFGSQKQSYVKAIQLLQNKIVNMEEELSEMEAKDKKMTEQQQNIQKLKTQVNSLNNKTANYEKDKKYLDEVLKQNLKLKEQIKNLQDSMELLKIQKNSLMQNLSLIGQMSARQEKQKNIVQQVVQRNYEYKVKNKELEMEIETYKNKLREKEQELNNSKTQLAPLKQQVTQLQASCQHYAQSLLQISRLQEQLKSKECHIRMVNDKIEELQRKLQLLQQLQDKITQLEEQLQNQTVLTSALREEIQQLAEQKQQVTKQKESLEAQNRILKHTQAIIKENQQHIKGYAAENMKLKESIQQSEGIMCYLEQQNRILKLKLEEREGVSRKNIATETDEPLKVKSTENLEQTLKNNKQNQMTTKDKEKYTKSILNLNQLINFMMNYAKGYTFNQQNHIRENSWIHRQGSLYVRKMSNQANIESKIRNYLKVKQIVQDDPRVKEVYDTYVDILNSYFTHLRYL